MAESPAEVPPYAHGRCLVGRNPRSGFRRASLRRRSRSMTRRRRDPVHGDAARRLPQVPAANAIVGDDFVQHRPRQRTGGGACGTGDHVEAGVRGRASLSRGLRMPLQPCRQPPPVVVHRLGVEVVDARVAAPAAAVAGQRRLGRLRARVVVDGRLHVRSVPRVATLRCAWHVGAARRRPAPCRVQTSRCASSELRRRQGSGMLNSISAIQAMRLDSDSRCGCASAVSGSGSSAKPPASSSRSTARACAASASGTRTRTPPTASRHSQFATAVWSSATCASIPSARRRPQAMCASIGSW